MCKRQILVVLMGLMPLWLMAQPAQTEADASRREKAYIHTDRPFYLIGDTIWFKGYLVDAQTHRMQETESRYLYVELIK